MSDNESTGGGKRGSVYGKKKTFSKNTEAYKILQKMFEDGLISPTDKPSDVRLSKTEFQEYSVTQFRSQFNKMKTLIGVTTKEAYKKMMEKEKKPTVGPPNDTMPPSDNEEEEAVEDYCADHSLLWQPKKLVACWQNRHGVKHVSMIFHLTGGAADTDTNAVECGVTDNGMEFIISELWSETIEKIDEFYLLFPRHQDETEDEFKRRQYAMEDLIRPHCASGRRMRSTFKFTLPIKVDPKSMRVRYAGTNDGTRICHVDLAERLKKEVQQVVMLDRGRGRGLKRPHQGDDNGKWSELAK
ncbi:hypothetical protein SEMRO_302_G112320.1 [Seminavis robusta]|uniref:Uncharacterized protein n=1 Tax=Seminavis robusta TaxID=568900 RepID=A0A9N8HC34_9STRA|nr:hypothetical protein SEMRO_302_G112320.1 [Seminavis robusta]|eukprot:Sro302_g112320.1 n/a (299) ;mRNA; f:72247-73222